MWAAFFTTLGAWVTYTLVTAIGLDWGIAVLLFIAYMAWIPAQRDSVRRWRRWARRSRW